MRRGRSRATIRKKERERKKERKKEIGRKEEGKKERRKERERERERERNIIKERDIRVTAACCFGRSKIMLKENSSLCDY